MRGITEEQVALFAYVHLEERIPRDHPLRRSGKSIQKAPLRNTHKTAFKNKRLSCAVLPGSRFLPGKTCSIFSHANSYRFATSIPPVSTRIVDHRSSPRRWP